MILASDAMGICDAALQVSGIGQIDKRRQAYTTQIEVYGKTKAFEP